MSRKAFDKHHDQRLADEVATPSNRCPAHGCPNAASTSFDGSRWACYYHARALPDQWPEVTDDVFKRWPASCNWNHPEKVAYEDEQAAKRRAALPLRVGPVGGMGGLLGPLASRE